MAQQDQKLSGGVQATYTISDVKYVRIQVYDSAGFYLTDVSSDAKDVNSNISFCIDQAISNLNGTIRDDKADIAIQNGIIATQQKIYDDPTSTPEQKQTALNTIRRRQGIITQKELQIQECNIAITGLNAKDH